jgi:hypothetical protein
LSDTTLPIHRLTGDRAIGWREARRGEEGPQPIWPIRGGAETDVADQDTEADSQTADEDAAADQGDDTNGDSGDDGPVDWEAKAKELQTKVEAQQRINRNLERRTRKDKARLDELQGAKPAAANTGDGKQAKPDEAVDVEKIRAEALEEAKKEARLEALKERVLDKIEAKAKDFADPADAVAMLMRGRTSDEFIDGDKIDVESIQDALTELLEKKPYLGVAAQGGKNRFQGSAEAGAKPAKPARPQSLDEAVRRRFAPK